MPSMMGLRARVSIAACGVVLGLSTATAFAEPTKAEPTVDGATRATARQLGYEGIQDYQREDYRAATDKLERAYKMLKAPSLALWSARALEKSGKFVEAAERYLEATRLPDDPGGEPSVQQKSREEAAQDREALLPRIPTLLIEVEGATPDDIVITIAGEDVPNTVVGSSRPTNPGDAVVEGRLGQQTVKLRVALMEGERKSITLTFQANPAAPAATAAAANAPEADKGSRGSWQRPVGWVGIGLGGAGIVLGAITGGIAVGSQLEDCPGGVCDPTVPQGDISSYNTLLDVSTVGFIAGGVLAAAGVTLLVTAPKGKPGAASIQPFVGLTGAGLRGRF
jgi:hypothetical protein